MKTAIDSRTLLKLYIEMQIETLQTRFARLHGHLPSPEETGQLITEAASADNGELARRWCRVWQRVLKLASIDPENRWFSGIEFQDDPSPEECLWHFIKNGGWDDLRTRHPEIITNLELEITNLNQ